MNINIISVGKVKEDYYVRAMAEYEKRLGRFCRVGTIYLPDKAICDRASEKECEQIKDAEGALILKSIAKNDFVIAMCVEGKMLTSEAFALELKSIMQHHSTLDFVIGGSLGLSNAVKSRADMRMSLSAMTMPHRLARLVTEEQIYRAFKINSNETYHK